MANFGVGAMGMGPAEASVPHLHYPQDALRQGGLMHLKDLAVSSHPLEQPLKQYQAVKQEEKKNFLRNTQGIHAAMRLNMEEAILSQYRRLPGFHSEFLGLETMRDANVQIGFEDILNDPRESMDAPMPMHDAMEQMLGVMPVEPMHANLGIHRPLA